MYGFKNVNGKIIIDKYQMKIATLVDQLKLYGLTDLEIRDIFNKFKVPKASGGNDFYFDMIKNKILSTASEISKQRLQ